MNVENDPRACPWRLLIDWLESAMLSQDVAPAQVARAAGMPPSTLNGLLNCRHRPSIQTLERLARYFHQPPSLLRELAAMPEPRPARAAVLAGVSSVWLVPRVTEAGAGGTYVPEGYELVAPIRGASTRIIAVTVRGDCMAPRIEAGDTVIVDLARDWRERDVVLAEVEGELVIKRVWSRNGQVVLRADDPDYPEIDNPSTRVLGPVIKIEKTP